MLERRDQPRFPPLALREALVNALCHRDYSIPGGAVNVAVYDDRLEITRCPFRKLSTRSQGSGQAAWLMRLNGSRFGDPLKAATSWMSPMPFPFAETVSLSDAQRAQLETLVRAGSTPQALAFRCRLILRAGDKDHPTNLQIAAEFHCDRHTVAAWRNRYIEKGLAGLQDAPRSGRPRRFPPSERLNVISLASSTTDTIVRPPGGPSMTWLPP